MDQELEPMEVEEDASNFDKIIESEVKSNAVSPNTNEVMNVADARYANKGGTFLTGIDIFSLKGKEKIEERAKRFGLNDEQIFSRLQEYQDLYASMGVTEENENTKNFRLNVLHVRGTEEMSTKDVFKYFEDYAPASIEWINDVSCNIVWLDSASAARALVGLSKKIIGISNQTQSGENNCDSIMKEKEIAGYDEAIHIKDIEYPLPPGIWRKGISYPKSKGIFMRFATRSDKKQPNAEKISKYYKKYGNPNYGGVRGILTESKKRTYSETSQRKKKLKGNLADQDVEAIAKNPWGDLSQNWGVGDTIEEDFIRKYHSPDHSSSIKDRLGSKSQLKERLPVSEESDSDSCSDSEEEWSKKSKIPRMRMRADDEEEKVQKRLNKLRKQEKLNANKDLRSRLGRPKEPVRDAIQIVITNYDNPRADVSEEEEGEIVDSENEDQNIKNNDDEEVEEDEEAEEDDDDEDENDEVEQEAVGEREELEESEAAVEEQEDDDGDEEKEEGEDDSDNISDISEKEVRGPKGSVIKVVPRKPRIASTVWTRLNHNAVKSEVKAINNSQSLSLQRDLRETLRGDLRSRLGSRTKTKCRSPLRIEVKNDKCDEENHVSE